MITHEYLTHLSDGVCGKKLQQLDGLPEMFSVDEVLLIL